EVTSIEAICADLHVYTVVRGYEQAHRLQKARHTRTFVNMTDSDVATKIAKAAGLKIGTVDDTDTAHDHLAQIAQTDWEFLKQRARENGYETGVVGGEFYFRRPPGMPAGGGLLGAAASMAASALGLGGATRPRRWPRGWPNTSAARSPRPRGTPSATPTCRPAPRSTSSRYRPRSPASGRSPTRGTSSTRPRAAITPGSS